MMKRHLLIAVALVALIVAACSGATTTASTTAPTVASTSAPAHAPTTAASAPTPSQAAVARCAETPGVAPSATVEWNVPVVGSPTIKAGQAVAFTTIGTSPTVTEWGANGQAAVNPCIDKELLTTKTVVVTFYQPGAYLIGCRKVADMKTVIHVQ